MRCSKIQNEPSNSRTRWILELCPAVFQAPMAKVKVWRIQQKGGGARLSQSQHVRQPQNLWSFARSFDNSGSRAGGTPALRSILGQHAQDITIGTPDLSGSNVRQLHIYRMNPAFHKRAERSPVNSTPSFPPARMI
jgi:hypothetical protein